MESKFACAVVMLLNLISLYQMNWTILLHTLKRYYERKRLVSVLIGFSGLQLKGNVRKTRKRRRFWVRPGRTSLWWDNMI